MSLVDVIIGVRNEEKHLERCLNSLQNQTITDISILVVDGQSTDRTRDIVLEKSKKDTRIKLLENPNQIISSARNIGISVSKAEYVAYLDGHCYVNSDWLELLLASYQEYGKKCKLGAVGSTYASPDDDTFFGRVVASVLRTPFGGFGTAYSKDEKFELVDTVAFAIYKRSILDKEEVIYDEKMTQCEDTDFNYQLVKKGYTLLKHPHAYVYQYRRPTSHQFFLQMVKYGEGRILFIKKHPETFRFYYLLPLMVLIYFFIVLVLFLFSIFGYFPVGVMLAFMVPILCYLILCFYYTLAIYRETREFQSIYALLIFPSVHLGFGWGFLKGMLK